MRDINLKQIIEQFPDCVTDGAKLKAILLDTYPEMPKAIVNTLVIMVNSGIAKEIQDSENITKLDKSRWQKKLEDDYGLSERIVSTCIEIFTECVAYDYDLADFEIKNGVLIKYKGNSTNVVVPSCVTSIGESAFLYSKISEVTISDSVTTIGQNSFFGCYKLWKITIGSGVVSIGDNAFGGCRFLQEITVSENNVKYHSDGNCLIETKSKTVIWGCWKSIIPNDGSAIAIAKHAFWGKCPVISDKIVDIREQAIENDAVGPEKIDVADGNKKYHSNGNCLIENESKTLILGCKNSIIPSDGSVTSIGNYAFLNCGGLKNIIIPDNVISIGDRVFEHCGGLEKIVVASNNPTYHSNGNCLIKTESKTLILGCKNSVVPTNGSVTKIGDYAFCGCEGLIRITIPIGITTIEEFAFCDCFSLMQLSIPDGVSFIGEGAFQCCGKLTKIILPNGLTSICNQTFAYSGLTNITVSSTIKAIGAYAFYGCDKLTEIKFVGTIDQWNSIDKGTDYLKDTAVREILCSDGIASV